MPLQKWKLLSKKDVSPHTWFPIEMRTYELPSGKIVDDFSVTTVADVAMIVPRTTDGKMVLVRQYKPGIDELLIQFPAGRIEPNHHDMQEAAMHELAEETGIQKEKHELTFFGAYCTFPTKASEKIHLYFVDNCEVNSQQDLDPTEEIELLFVEPRELDQMIVDNVIQCIQTVGVWELTKKRFLSKK